MLIHKSLIAAVSLFLFVSASGCGGSGSSSKSGSDAAFSSSSASAGSSSAALNATSWLSIDIGSASGTTSATVDALTIGGMGKFESGKQVFRYVYTAVSGNFTITAKLNSYTGASGNQGWAGLLLAPDLASTATAFFYGAGVCRGDGTYYYGQRLAAGNITKNTLGAPSVLGTNVYLKLSRIGDAYSASYSLDGGTTWGTAQTATFTAALPSTVNIGFCVNSGSSTDSAIAAFSDIIITDASGAVIGGGTGSNASAPSSSASSTASTASASTTPIAVPNPVPAQSAPGASDTIFPLTADSSTTDQTVALTAALAALPAGTTLFIPAGTYKVDSQITIDATNSGSVTAYKNLASYNGSVTFDFSAQPYGDTGSVSNPRGLQVNGNYWHVYGIEFKGSADNGLFVGGNWNIIEACTFHNNRDSGLQIARAASTLTDISQWPSYNLILNCESYDNDDVPPNGGENADGFACKLTAGPGNVFRGCISHNNIDDGWDLYTKTETGPIGAVTIEQCIAFSNGTLTNGTVNLNGDKNGFKLGGEKIAVSHVVTQCVSFSNGKNGFTWNSNPGAIRLVNNTAWDNVEGNYKFDGSGTVPPAADESAAIFYNNLSFWISSSSQVGDRAGNNSGKKITNNCFWNKTNVCLSGVTGVTAWSAADLKLTAITLPLNRNSDGSFNLGNFGKLTAASTLNGKGVVPAIASEGGIPDLPVSLSAYFGTSYNIGAK